MCLLNTVITACSGTFSTPFCLVLFIFHTFSSSLCYLKYVTTCVTPVPIISLLSIHTLLFLFFFLFFFIFSLPLLCSASPDPEGKPVVQVVNVSSSSIEIMWTPPPRETLHGEFLGFKLHYWPTDEPNNVTGLRFDPGTRVGLLFSSRDLITTLFTSLLLGVGCHC